MSVSSQITGYDFTLKCLKSDGTEYSKDDVSKMLQPLCKNYVFQKEKSETGYLHFQGRIRLIKKSIKSTLLKHFKDYDLADVPSFSPTSGQVFQTKNFNYVLKSETRVEGPFTDKDFIPEKLKEPEYIPRQYRYAYDEFYDWQKKIYDDSLVFDTRTINVIVDTKGNVGKSTIANIIAIKKNGLIIPNVDDSEKIIYSVCNILQSKNVRDVIPIFVDMPRAMSKLTLNNFYSAIETIKSGRLYDIRYKYTEWLIDSPVIWVFTNEYPDVSLLSRDRWKVWTITDDKKLELYEKIDISECEEKTLKVKKISENIQKVFKERKAVLKKVKPCKSSD